MFSLEILTNVKTDKDCYKPWVGELKAEPTSDEVSVLELLGAGDVWIVRGVE
jgi:hypothetical protein